MGESGRIYPAILRQIRKIRPNDYGAYLRGRRPDGWHRGHHAATANSSKRGSTRNGCSPRAWWIVQTTCSTNRPTGAALFGVFRHERHGLVDDEMRRRLRLVVPHLRRAILVGRVIDLSTATAARFADCLDSLAAGMFLVAATGTIVHANTSGRVMLDSGDVLRAVVGRLVASDPDSTRRCRRSSRLRPTVTPPWASKVSPNPWPRILTASAMWPTSCL